MDEGGREGDGLDATADTRAEPERAAVALGLAAAALATTALAARRQIGGYTGDVLGACQQVAEIVILLVAARF